MHDYVLDELPQLIAATFPVSDKRSIFGHSMGGHGALVLALRNLDRFKSVLVFSPIGNPSNCPWGQKTFTAYLGKDSAAWADHDASLLRGNAARGVPALVGQGEADDFLEEQLKPETLEAATNAWLSVGAEPPLRL